MPGSPWLPVNPAAQPDGDNALPAFVALRQIWLWGISMDNRPMVGLGLFDQWMREISLPTLRAWIDDEL